MIQKIQLRGISRSPSDRMTADGGCAESFNVITDRAEIAPMPEPQDITEAAGLPTDESFEVLYIHKGSGYTNYICRRGNDIGIYGSVKWVMPEDLKEKKWAYPEDLIEPPTPLEGDTREADYSVRIDAVYYEGTPEYVLGSYEKGDYYEVVKQTGGSQSEVEYSLRYVGVLMSTNTFEPFLTLDDADAIENFCAIGNVFICTVNGELNYFLFIDGQYEKTVSGMIRLPEITIQLSGMVKQQDGIEKRDFLGTYNHPMIGTIPLDTFKDSKFERTYRVVRYSLVLFNGDEVFGQPILVFETDARGDNFVVDDFDYVYNASYDYGSESGYVYTVNTNEVTFKTHYKYCAATQFKHSLVNYDDITHLHTIVQSLRMYSSESFKTTIKVSPQGERNVNYTYHVTDATLTEDSVESTQESGTMTLKVPIYQYVYDESLQRNIRDIKNFNLVKEYHFDIDDIDINDENAPMTQLREGDTIIFPTDEELKTNLELNTELEYVQSLLRVSKLLTYNQRLYAMGGTRKETAKLPFALASASDFLSSSGDTYTFAFKITNPNTGESCIRVPKDDGVIWFSEDTNFRYLPFLSYPDSNCVKAYVGIRDAGGRAVTYEVDMKPWASVVGYSYAIIDPTMGKTLGDALRAQGGGKVQQLQMESEQATVYDKLYVSEAQNPFIFPHSYSFGADILGAATTTKAISTGQFGQFPLYVFSTDGIWAMELAADGSFVSKKPLSRDVALSNGCITPIEQAIVFTTDKGVMMLTGSDIQNISPNMLGKHYSMDEKLRDVINGSPFRDVVSQDTDSFMDFMRNAQCAYDYTGQRLLFFNDSKEYQYVYKLNTATWHKTSVIIPKHHSAHILNSYPDCYICNYEPDEASTLLNLSATLETDGATPMKGVIVTRPFDLGYPDVRKVIKSIRIRGYFNRQDVKYILQGSMDGINWGILPSLHSGSFKLFRLVIMADLGKDERISWVDVDFDVRFNNRLR